MKRPALILVTASLLLSGCGGSSGDGTPSIAQTTGGAVTTTPTPTTTATTKAVQTSATGGQTRESLRDAVRSALLANHHLAVRVLWTNRVLPTARSSTRGPALAAMTASARDRQSKGIRVRMIRDDYQILSIAIAPSRARATAIARSIQTVVPSHLNGRRLGRSVQLNERARIDLRRVGSSGRFVVWEFTLLK